MIAVARFPLACSRSRLSRAALDEVNQRRTTRRLPLAISRAISPGVMVTPAKCHAERLGASTKTCQCGRFVRCWRRGID